MKINVGDLGKSIDILLEQFRIIYGDNINIDTDFYWSIPHLQKIDMSENPDPELNVGSLMDHVDVVERLARGDIEPSPLMLRDVGEVMKHLGEATLAIKKIE